MNKREYKLKIKIYFEKSKLKNKIRIKNQFWKIKTENQNQKFYFEKVKN